MKQLQQGKIFLLKGTLTKPGQCLKHPKTNNGINTVARTGDLFLSFFLSLSLPLFNLSIFSFTLPLKQNPHPSVLIRKNKELTYMNLHVKCVIY